MKSPLSLLTLCLVLSACATAPEPAAPQALVPAQWSLVGTEPARQVDRLWWRQFASPELDRLIEQARAGSHDLAAAMARVRQARASAVIARASQWPQVQAGVNASRQKLLRGNGYSQLDADSSDQTVDYFDASLTASYEVDFWGGQAAARESARQSLQASEFDRATVELTLLGAVADTYVRSLALEEQGRIAQLNLNNALDVLTLVQTRFESGSATALELAQQQSLVAAQQRRVPLLRQQARDASISLAALLGQPLQALDLQRQGFARLAWPDIASGVPSELLTRRPDIASAEARLAAAKADVQVARAAMLPRLTLSATVGSGAASAADVLRSPFYALTAGLIAPIFNNGRLGAERDLATARAQELLQVYRGTLITGFADVEKALNSIDGLDRQRQWQDQELAQAQRAFDIAQTRYQAGAEGLLTVLDTQRTLYQAQDLNVQLRLSRLQASIALYKALGGGWQMP